MFSRRRLLATTGLTAAALLGLGVGRAHAFREEEAPIGDVWAVRDAQARCRAISTHDQMFAVVQAEIEAGPLAPEERARIMAAATCPTCGQLLRG